MLKLEADKLKLQPRRSEHILEEGQLADDLGLKGHASELQAPQQLVTPRLWISACRTEYIYTDPHRPHQTHIFNYENGGKSRGSQWESGEGGTWYVRKLGHVTRNCNYHTAASPGRAPYRNLARYKEREPASRELPSILGPD
jgi:hypothetical protein